MCQREDDGGGAVVAFIAGLLIGALLLWVFTPPCDEPDNIPLQNASMSIWHTDGHGEGVDVYVNGELVGTDGEWQHLFLNFFDPEKTIEVGKTD